MRKREADFGPVWQGGIYWAKPESHLFSVKVHFPKLDVAGSIPVSRFWFQDLSRTTIPAVSVRFQIERT
jgi:hypothetical protein